tara:strand:- start:215 stop:370 length:156 start_codon:yes stop_codon:yes gene_type:complete
LKESFIQGYGISILINELFLISFCASSIAREDQPEATPVSREYFIFFIFTN